MGLVSSKPEEKQCCPCPEEKSFSRLDNVTGQVESVAHAKRVGGRKLKNKSKGKGKGKKTKRARRFQVGGKGNASTRNRRTGKK